MGKDLVKRGTGFWQEMGSCCMKVILEGTDIPLPPPIRAISSNSLPMVKAVSRAGWDIGRS